MVSPNTELVEYVVNLYKVVSDYIYEALLSILCVGLTTSVLIKGVKEGIRYSSVLLLGEYLLLLYSTTVIFRSQRPLRVYEVQPLYSYFHDSANHYLMIDNILNVVAFIPVGLLLPICWRRIQWWKILSIGCCLSLSIEVFQYVFMKGNANVDDIMHNTLGCLIGYGICKAVIGL